jgi:hypothetical protein
MTLSVLRKILENEKYGHWDSVSSRDRSLHSRQLGGKNPRSAEELFNAQKKGARSIPSPAFSFFSVRESDNGSTALHLYSTPILSGAQAIVAEFSDF